MAQHYQILVVGGGNAGISVTSQLLRKRPDLQIGIIEPSETHYYQPAWTLVGGGDFDIQKTARPQASVMPKKAKWIKDRVVGFEPENNALITDSQRLTYDYLIVAPGVQLDWDKIEGAKETLGKNGVTSNYLFHLAPYTWEAIQQVKAGDTLIFTNPNTPIKCGGAPQKILYLLSDYLGKKGILDKVNIHFYSGGGVLFGVEKYAKTLQKVVERYGIKTHYKHNLVKVDGDKKLAWFKNAEGELIEMPFNFLHLVPPNAAPDFIKSSSLAIPDAEKEKNPGCQDTPAGHSKNFLGWVDVDKHTLQHKRYRNVFSLGDVTNTPNAKTGAAVRKQAPVVVQNIMDCMNGQPLTGTYNGYGSCPLITGYGKLVMAEFDYDLKPVETFPIDQSKERWSMYQLKKHLLPWMYWNRILPGKA
jgi:sulfide:quinone oxidoreductase